MIGIIKRNHKNILIIFGLFVIGLIAYRHPIQFASLHMSDDVIPIIGTLSGHIGDISTVHDGEGNLRAEWPQGTNIPQGSNYHVSKMIFPGQSINVDIIQAITPACERGGIHGQSCPTVISVDMPGNTSMSHSYIFDTCLVGGHSTMTINGHDLPILSCAYETDKDGMER